jgi:hypothetical protein
MSEFLSLYDVVFGVRDTKGVGVETDDGRFVSRHGIKYKVKSVDMAMAVCAIEDENCKSYCFDYFGRFGTAKAEAKEEVIASLVNYQRVLLLDNPNDVCEYEEYLSDADMTPAWHAFGWPADELPDFEACYENWKVKNGMEGKQAPANKQPAVQSHIWRLMNKLLRHAIGDDVYSELLKENYGAGVKALHTHPSKSFRVTENEKKALKRHIEMIMTLGKL